MEIAFKNPEAATIGIELELQLLDRTSLDLADGILPLMELFPGCPYVKPEFIQNTVEIASKPSESLEEIEQQMIALVSELETKCNMLNMTLCGAGTHPFGQKLATLTPTPRYQRIEEALGLLSHTQITFSTHVHLSMPSGDRAIAVMDRLKAYLPLLIGLSANSPFWRDYDTGYASYRHRILAAARSYGVPPSFPDWNSFEQFADTSRRVGIFPSINDIHWDIRPRPHLGTIEVRTMDAMATVHEAKVLAGFLRALVAHIADKIRRGEQGSLLQLPPWYIQKENYFQASRVGLEAICFTPRPEDARSLGDMAKILIDQLAPAAEQFGATSDLHELRLKLEGNELGYARQRESFRDSGSRREVVRMLVSKLSQEARPEAPTNLISFPVDA